MARPKVTIDEKRVEEMAAVFCTLEEIAIETNCSVNTLRRRCGDALARGKNRGKVKLRQRQWEKMEEGSVTLLVWLGKQVLGQSDKMENGINEEQYSRLFEAAHAAMVSTAGAGRTASGNMEVQK